MTDLFEGEIPFELFIFFSTTSYTLSSLNMKSNFGLLLWFLLLLKMKINVSLSLQ